MGKSKNNSTDDLNSPFELLIGKKACRLFIGIFLCIIIIPPLYRNIFEISAKLQTDELNHDSSWTPVIELFNKKKNQSLNEHLKSFEKNLETAFFAETPRKLIQSTLSLSPLKEGNRNVRIGKDGWLFLDDAIESLTGQGPFHDGPFPFQKDGNSPADAIKRFADQLDNFGARLILISIPSKAMIYPEKINHNIKGPISHPDAQRLVSELNSLPNLDVLDLTRSLFNLKKDKKVFLKQDTHWTPEAMEEAAKIIANHIKSMDINIDKVNLNPKQKEGRKAYGDLVEKINIWDGSFNQESVIAKPIKGNTRDRNSKIILLGDSFTNIYSSNEGLGWGNNAGLPEHIASNVGTPIDVISINGGGATKVRKKLAQRRGSSEDMKNKKVVIWAITCRDLFLSQEQCIDRNISWDNVSFNKRPLEKKPTNNKITIRAKLIEKPKIPDPNQTTYKDLLYGADYEIIETISGQVPEEGKKIAIVNWAFKNRVLLPSANYEIGSVRNLQLMPFEEMKDLQTLEQMYEGDNFDLFWELPKTSEKTQEIGQIKSENKAFRHKIALIVSSLFTIFIFIGTNRIPEHYCR